MPGLKLDAFNSYVLTISLLCLTSPGLTNSGLIGSNLDLPLPPVPENKAMTAKLEAILQNGTALGCSTIEYAQVALPIFNGIIGRRDRWNSFNVYSDPVYNLQERTLINNALTRLQEAVRCIRFGIYRPGARPSGDYVHVKNGNGCWSYVGKLGGAQDLSLQSPGCMTIGLVMHEMIHALGFLHEQSRHDRDEHVYILWHNIETGREPNFNKYNLSEMNTYGVPYNQRSILHYGGKDFSKNEEQTIIAKNGGQVGTTGNLEQTDIDKLRKAFNC